MPSASSVNPASCYSVDDGLFNCPRCRSGFQTAVLLTRHLTETHDVVFSFRCAKCSVGSSDKEWLANHEQKCTAAGDKSGKGGGSVQPPTEAPVSID
jgi:hypothetical protein